MAKAKINSLRPSISAAPEFESGILLVYDEITRILSAEDSRKHKVSPVKGTETIVGASNDATRQGRESIRLGYSVSDLVHTYGAVCQAVTEFAAENKEHITASEFRSLNFAIDAAVAEAAVGFIDTQRVPVKTTPTR